jgi:hypothetical protein
MNLNDEINQYAQLRAENFQIEQGKKRLNRVFQCKFLIFNYLKYAKKLYH